MRYTDEQISAIEALGTNVLLSAAAGSGKTATLVERVMRLTLQGGDVDDMLVVTFTRAAAAGMREKLTRAFSEMAAEGDARCRDQLLRLERAPITTLHAFCADFLRENFESAGVDPAFSILDDADEKTLMKAALDAAVERAYEAGGGLLEKLDYGRGPEGVREMAEKLARFLESRPEPEKWLDAALKGSPKAWQKEILGAARRAADEALIYLSQALELDLPGHYVETLAADIDRLNDITKIDDYEEMRGAIAGFKLTTPRGRNAGFDPETIEYAKSLKESAKRRIEGAGIIGLPLDVALSDSMYALEGARALADIALDARRTLDELKAGRGALAYYDLEARTLRALDNPEVARAARERYSYVFVDEYQDTSDIQDAIIRKVARGDNLFMVGDVKQSIYRFRQAAPRLFLTKYEQYGAGQGGRLLPLTRNFRSTKAILDFINAVFSRLMTGGDSEIAYDDLAYLRPGEAAEDGARVELHALTGAGEDELSAAQREGLMIAGEIKRLMALDSDLRFRDFAILTRQGARAFGAIMPMLVSQGVPCYADGGEGYFDTLEVRLTLSLLRLIDNFHSDEDLIGVLRSCVCSLSVEELADIRLCRREGSFADAALERSGAGDALAGKLNELFRMLDTWRLRAGAMGLDELARVVTEDSGLYAYVGALPGGAQRQANIDLFIVKAAAYDRDVSGSLNRFLAFAQGLEKSGSGDAAHALGENDDVVRLMTVHHSKGLEFKVVIGARLDSRLRAEKNEDSMLCHPRLGLGLMRYDAELRSRRNTLARAAVAERANREGLAEELRVLYVLFTRAQKRLILTGSVRDMSRARTLWRSASATPALAGSLMGITMAALDGGGEFIDIYEHPAADYAPPGIDMARREIRAEPGEPDAELLRGYKWKYPYEGADETPIKLTASGLTRGIDGPANAEALAPRPRFMQAGGMTGAEKGTAYHRAMQLIKFEPLTGLSGSELSANLITQLNAMTASGLMTKDERAAVRPGVLAAFLDSATGLRLRAAGQIRREMPFNVLMRSEDALMPEEMRGAAGDILVQGTIDCCFMEDGEWVLLDYKTGGSDDMDAMRERYARQLDLYAFALERISGIKVREKILCLISRNTEISL